MKAKSLAIQRFPFLSFNSTSVHGDGKESYILYTGLLPHFFERHTWKTISYILCGSFLFSFLLGKMTFGCSSNLYRWVALYANFFGVKKRCCNLESFSTVFKHKVAFANAITMILSFIVKLELTFWHLLVVPTMGLIHDDTQVKRLKWSNRYAIEWSTHFLCSFLLNILM